MFRYILSIFFAVLLSGFLVYSTLSWSFGKQESGSGAPNLNIQYSTLSNIDAQASDQLIYTPFRGDTPDESAPIYADFWRLSSALLLPTNGFQSLTSDLKKTGEHRIMLGNMNGIFSWYDPFVNEALEDATNHFQIDQITSGSFYIGRETDTTISVYSIDAVLDLSFLHDSRTMTKMIVFPGMYVRFHPKLNHTLQGADLFRIMQTLKGSDATVTTGIEFVDPRIQVDAENKTFFMYRLPHETRILFALLHRIFSDRVRAVDLLRQYERGNIPEFTTDSDGRTIQNPTKYTYRLLSKIQSIFSRAVSAEMSSDEFRSQIETVLNELSSLIPGNPAQELIEQFLIDGRFALFLDVNNAQYHDIYRIAAELVGIAPTTGKGKLFQSLSSIFSKNLLENTSAAHGNIDRYMLAIAELKNTLNINEMLTSDYFDLSLYAYLIFEKMTDGMKVERIVLESDMIYQLYITLFQATQKYAGGITNSTLASTAQKSLILSFYEPLMHMLVNSLYEVYAQNIDGAIFIKHAFLDKETPNFPLAFTSNLMELESVVRNVYDRALAGLPISGNDLRVRDALYKHITLLRAFNSMIARGNYKTYRSAPYQAEWSGSVMPRYSHQTQGIIRQSSHMDQISSQWSALLPQPVIVLARVLSTDMILPENVRTAGDAYRIRMQHTDASIDFVYTPRSGMISDIVLHLEEFPNVTVVDSMSLGDFRLFLMQVADYERRISKFFTRYNIHTTDALSILVKAGHIRLGNASYVLEN